MSRDSRVSAQTRIEFSRIIKDRNFLRCFSHDYLSSLVLSSSSSSSLLSLSLTVTLAVEMRSPQPPQAALRNGETPSPRPRIQSHHPPHFHSTVSVQKLRRLNTLIFVFRLAAFCFSVAASIFMLVNPRGSNSPRWYNFDAFRFVLAANAIVAVYSLFEMGASVWEISSGVTLLPEILQVWFDFGHDQVFAYLLLSADSAGTALARTMKATDTCTDNNAFCVQTDISIALGFAGFLFLGLSSLLSGFRVVCFMINGSRFHL